jgi:ketol-acid reductoisomerase
MANMYYENDAKKEFISNKKVAVIGFGSQGHAHAQNMADNGIDVVIGLYEGSKSKASAVEKGFTVLNTPEAVQAADVVMVLVNDEKQAALYKNDIEPYLSEGMTLCFAHGFNIHYGQIVPPADVDVIMIAPKGPGHTLRGQFTEGRGVPCLIAVYQDYSGNARDTALAYAWAIGGTRAGVLETTFKEETETDLFGEQTVLCGGVVALMRAGYEVMLEAGYQPESAYFECMHEMKLIIDLCVSGGISFMHHSISDTAEYGDYRVGGRIITEETKDEMRKVLEEIRDGSFARDWILENQANRPYFRAKQLEDRNHPSEIVGKRLREQMIWKEK